MLRSPLHRLVSGSMCLVRYQGHRSGREITLPTQYARDNGNLVVLVGRPDEKTWWRNFLRNWPAEVLLQGNWVPMTARAIVGADEPKTATRLVNIYLKRFPRAEKTLGAGTIDDRIARAVVVLFRPRDPT